MARTDIEWAEKVWNPATGCNKISPGCKNCYAETIAKRFWGERKFTDVEIHYDRLEQPLHWRKPAMIFVNSMSDLFHEKLPFEFIDQVFAIMLSTRHTYQILTKRPKRMLEYFNWSNRILNTAKNVWLGVSVENQKTADERIPLLLETPAKVRWISAEPLLEKIDLNNYLYTRYIMGGARHMYNQLDWVVVGGESGKNKRPFNSDWARKIRNDCKAAEVPFFMKQMDKIREIPPDLFIREYPNDNR